MAEQEHYKFLKEFIKHSESNIKEKPFVKEQKKKNKEWFDYAKDDIEWRHESRKFYSCFFLWLIAIQNFLVFGLVVWGFVSNKLADLSIIFSVLVAATLAETYFLLRVMVQWAFSEINYKDLKN